MANQSGTMALFDLGGTSIKQACWRNSRLEKLGESPAKAEEGGQAILRRIATGAREIAGRELGAIAISSAGQIDFQQGRVTQANRNLPGYTGLPVKSYLEEACGVPVRVDNDVYCAALGEARYGAGRGLRHFICLTVGTGIGGAAFIDGKLYRGAHYGAAEFGALLIHPELQSADDPLSGCLERSASTAALIRRCREFDAELVSGRLIMAERGRPEVKEAIVAWLNELLLGLRSLIHLYDPETVILGGGIMEQNSLIEHIRTHLPEKLLPAYRSVSIVHAFLGNRAGLYGASTLFDTEED